MGDDAVIVPFTVDPDAIGMAGVPAPVRRAAHARLLGLWQRHGLLVHGGEKLAGSPLAAAVSALPVDLRKRWQEAFRRLRTTPAPAGFPGLDHVAGPADLAVLSGIADLACVEEARGLALGLSEARTSLLLADLGIEVCRFDCADQARAFEHAEALSQGAIREGTPVEGAWRERFARLAAHSRTVVLVDRYAARTHRERHATPSGLASWLERLGRDGHRLAVTLFTATDATAPPAETAGLVVEAASALSLPGIRELTVCVLADADFGKVSHGRFVRFDGTVCELDVGLDVLSGTRVGRTCQLSAKPRSDDHRERERALAERTLLSLHADLVG